MYYKNNRAKVEPGKTWEDEHMGPSSQCILTRESETNLAGCLGTELIDEVEDLESANDEAPSSSSLSELEIVNECAQPKTHTDELQPSS